jgi:hypothetical protein
MIDQRNENILRRPFTFLAPFKEAHTTHLVDVKRLIYFLKWKVPSRAERPICVGEEHHASRDYRSFFFAVSNYPRADHSYVFLLLISTIGAIKRANDFQMICSRFCLKLGSY